MFAAHGFSLITFAALLGGIFVHFIKHYQQARSAGVSLSVKVYFVDNWTSSTASVISSLVLWASVPQVASMFPEAAASVGIDGEVGILGSFVCGFVGNSLADLISKRASAVSGK